MVLTAEDIFNSATVIPVIVIDELEQALPLAKALYSEGMRVLEITLRTPVGLQAISELREHMPEDAIIGAGTVTNSQQLQQVIDAGAQFAISPGATPALLQAAQDAPIALIPGVATVSEVMQGIDYGLRHFKLFPAAAIGGIALLKSIAGPFPDVRFCPTGGINKSNYQDYLALDNVACVGGSWVLPG